jgi:hypothetical protein
MHAFSQQGPVLRGWFLNLDKGFGPTKHIRDALKKVLVDQCVFAPVFTAILVPVFGFTQGMDRLQVKEKVKKVSALTKVQSAKTNCS